MKIGSFKRRSTWLVSMLACLAFLVMAVNVYDVSTSALAGQLLAALIILFIVIVCASALGWLIATWRKRRSR